MPGIEFALSDPRFAGVLLGLDNLTEERVLHAMVREHSNIIGTAVVEVMMHAVRTAEVGIRQLQALGLKVHL